LQRREPGGCRILAALDALPDADGEMPANLVVEIVDVERHLLLLARRRGVHDAADRLHELRPSIALARQLRLARRRQLVVLRALVGLADAPFGFQPAALHEAMEGGVERAGFDPEELVRLRADGLADAVAVLRPPLEGPQDQHVERALEELQALF